MNPVNLLILFLNQIPLTVHIEVSVRENVSEFTHTYHVCVFECVLTRASVFSVSPAPIFLEFTQRSPSAAVCKAFCCIFVRLLFLL